MSQVDTILKKLGIAELNPMQVEAGKAIREALEVVLLSPTGSGKTLAFLLPLIDLLKSDNPGVQAMILTPTRELALQIEQVFRSMGAGYKAAAVYGGRSIKKDFIELEHPPALLIGTPGRVADHMRRDSIDVASVHTLILDEFDKSLEVGFASDMQEIVRALYRLNRTVLTSATAALEIPDYVGLSNPTRVDYSSEEVSDLELRKVGYKKQDHEDLLLQILTDIGEQNCIVFCNFKESLSSLSQQLRAHRVAHGTFHGDMEQQDRERALIKFRNGTHRLLLATDLAARGIDIPELGAIVHYELPPREQEFTHRNGRTARMHATGKAYAMHALERNLPEFLQDIPDARLRDRDLPTPTGISTVFVSGGRKDKISKGDIAGLFFKTGGLSDGKLGVIELKRDCAFVGVPRSDTEQIIAKCNNQRLKKKKVRVYEVN